MLLERHNTQSLDMSDFSWKLNDILTFFDLLTKLFRIRRSLITYSRINSIYWNEISINAQLYWSNCLIWTWAAIIWTPITHKYFYFIRQVEVLITIIDMCLSRSEAMKINSINWKIEKSDDITNNVIFLIS